MELVELGPDDLLDVPGDRNSLKYDNYWNPESKWDNGWERAGAESFLRLGFSSEEAYRQNKDPVIVQKSGNPRLTFKRGCMLDEEDAAVIPTLLFIDTEEIDSSGIEYDIFQYYAPNSFREMYERGETSPSAMKDLAANAAAIDELGFGVINGEAIINSLLTRDGERAFFADFGSDLGRSGYEEHEQVYDASVAMLREEDIGTFQRHYEEFRSN
ncbi:MAG: hypothetical protein ABEJ99_03125 [Candidatus Nanohaloarchaea archaeon]